MHLYTLLDRWPASSRTVLLAMTGSALAIATVGLPFVPLSGLAYDAAVVALLIALLAAWAAVGFGFGVEAPPDVVEASVRHRALIAGQWQERRPDLASLPEVDPAFSLITWTDAIHEALSASVEGTLGPLTVEQVDGRDVSVWVAQQVDGELQGVRATLRRADERFTYVDHELLPYPQAPTVHDPDWPAARRALFARAEALDPHGFETLFEAINAEIDRVAANEETSAEDATYLSPQGLRCVTFWARGAGLPPAGDIAWLSVEEDAWHERIEVRCGARVLGLCRRAGQPDAPWRLWRLRTVA